MITLTSTAGTITNYKTNSHSNASTNEGGVSNWCCQRTLEVDNPNTVVGMQWKGNTAPLRKWDRTRIGAAERALSSVI